jgi:hypothetical protein
MADHADLISSVSDRVYTDVGERDKEEEEEGEEERAWAEDAINRDHSCLIWRKGSLLR